MFMGITVFVDGLSAHTLQQGIDSYNNGKKPDRNIIDGEDADPGEFPYQVRMLRDGFFFCMGTILDETTVLSAAHCFKDGIEGFTLLSEGTKYQAVAGDWDIRIDEGTEQFSNITGVALHPRYNSADMMSFDVCVLKVETPFVFNDFVAPVKLVTNRELEQRVRRQNECYMAGFGFASLDPLILPNILQKVKAKIYPRKFCDYFPYEGRWKSNVLCAFAPPKTACFGDSGGPLLCKTAKGQHVQVGIIQFGRCGYYSGNARIYSSREFIMEQMKKETLP
ncbi:chymotrypsin-1-like [Mya arenaria]|uniref:chymotrypsin-1-like n=1 Tax=Mya arenaria TaxID=6604 RepID=UPI0022E19630|nr:chymotrypsin-1-like [Mya arenaria]